MASEKRCHYEVLGLSQDCSPDEIRSAYKKLALQRHPDKLMRSGLSQAEATAQFQELSLAYEVLSDPKERAWYNSHRSQILFSDPNSGNSVPGSVIPNLFSFFSNTVYSGYTDNGKGFYKVYSDVFNKIYSNEINFCKKLGLRLDSVREAPVMGNLDSPYTQVTAFYNYWLSFSTVMDFCWVDQYDVMAGPNRKSRRVMEDENIKLRKKAKREYNETVRGLADFVKKRDKRVIDMMIKKNAEMEKKKMEERERKKKLERERMERAKAYQEPEWAKVDEEEVEEIEEFEDEEKEKKSKELYCVVCGKKFKSEKQWKNHEQSKKHKEKVAELKKSVGHEEDEGEEDSEVDEEHIEKEMAPNVNEMGERFREGFTMNEEENDVHNSELNDEEDGFFDAEESDEVKEFGVGDQNGDEDEDGETSVLEAMVSGHKNRKNRGSRRVNDDFSNETPLENVENEEEVMEYNNRKSRRRKGKKGRGKNDGVATKGDLDERKSDQEINGVDDTKGDFDERKSDQEINGVDDTKGDFDERKSDQEINGVDDMQQREESSSLSAVGNENDRNSDDQLKKNQRHVDNKGAAKKELNSKSKKSSKGKKGKEASKNSSNLCEKCGEEFESRNKLHKHLSDTGHASLKHR